MELIDGTGGLYRKEELIVGETYVMEVLQYKLHVPTLFDWANLYLQNAARLNPETFKEEDWILKKMKVQSFLRFKPIFRQSLLKSIMAFSDLVVHEIESLDFSNSILVATIFYIITGLNGHSILTLDELLKNCTLYDPSQIEECLDYINTFRPYYEWERKIIAENPIPIQKKLRFKEWNYLLQTYNSTILPGLVE